MPISMERERERRGEEEGSKRDGGGGGDITTFSRMNCANNQHGGDPDVQRLYSSKQLCKMELLNNLIRQSGTSLIALGYLFKQE